MKVILQIIKWFVILLILLFTVAVLMNGNIFQTVVLLLIAGVLIFWPSVFSHRFNPHTSRNIRISAVIVLVAMNFILFRPGPKTCIYRSPEAEAEVLRLYDEKAAAWPAGTGDIYIKTCYGAVHVLACGDPHDPPLLMFHAASMGAHSWAENLQPLLGHYHIYAIDNPGEGNKSRLCNPNVFPDSDSAIAALYAGIADSLHVRRSVVFGASNGGYIAMQYARHYPERVEALALFGPMGLTPLTDRSIMMLSVASLYPFRFVRNFVTSWALGSDSFVRSRYGDWFNSILSTMPSVAAPVPLTALQKQTISMPVLLVLGTRDPIVGKVENAVDAARHFPDAHIRILNSGHLVAVEKAQEVNRMISEFLIKNKYTEN